jgi:hypothetical protein
MKQQRLVIYVTNEQAKWIKKKAGLVPVSVWARHELVRAANCSPAMAPEKVAEDQKISKPRAEKVVVVEAAPPAGAEEAARAVLSRIQKVCEHNVNVGNHCWKCKGPAKEQS